MTHQHHILLSALLAGLLATSLNALATTANIAGSGVKEDDQSWEYRSAYQDSNGGSALFTQRVHYQQAFSQSQRFRAIIQQSQREGDSLELNWGRLEYQWQYQKPEDGSSSGALRFDLQIAEGDNEPHFARVVWIKDYGFGGWRSRFNLFVGTDLGANSRSGASLAARSQISRVVGDYNIGGQYLANLNTTTSMRAFDNQTHQAGIFVSRKLGEWSFFVSYLAGVSDRAPDDAIRFFFGKPL